MSIYVPVRIAFLRLQYHTAGMLVEAPQYHTGGILSKEQQKVIKVISVEVFEKRIELLRSNA